MPLTSAATTKGRALAAWQRRVDKVFGKMDFERYWEIKGGASRVQRWHMRHPLLSPALLIGVPAAAIVVIEVVLPLLGVMGASSSWPLLLVVVGLVLLPVQWSMHHHRAARYHAWKQASDAGVESSS